MVRTLRRDARTDDVLAAWIEACERNLAERGAVEPGWLSSRRREAVDRLAADGFPTRRSEAWRYTDPKAFVQARYAPLVPGTTDEARAVLARAPRVAGARRLVVVDGTFAPELSELPDPERSGDVRAGGLARQLADEPEALRGALASSAAVGEEPTAFADLCTGLFSDGAALIVPDRTVAPTPIEVLHLATGRDQAVTRPARLVLVAGAASQVQLIETFYGVGGAGSLTLGVTELELGPGAVVDRLRVQLEDGDDDHVAATRARLARDARLSTRLLSLGGRIARDDVSVVLDGEGASCDLRGLFAVGGEGHADCQARVDHVRPHGTSRQFYRGVLAGSARGVFEGRVHVREGAQKSDAEQRNDNLLLSPRAHVDTKPQLEILADDVQCRHGATIGELDEDAIFYLRARGIDEARARGLLVRGFAAAAVVDDLPAGPLREFADALVAERVERLYGEPRST